MADNYLDFSIRMKDEASSVIKTVGVNTEHLRKGVQQVTEEVSKAQRSIVDWAQAAQAADMLGQSIQQLFGVCKELTDAYQVQLVAETQLQTVMRQRMSATDEEIQSIKDLASAQQALGVIGDEVQLSGAQQMATFLNEKASLDSLIPAMNNLLAQQKGLNATNQDAVGIGNMMGKAMQGQVDVLQRVGVTFTEAQKKVLQYGTESERAAMLAQVIRDNVGEMNAELARTDAGKQKQLENTLGDIKEQFGAMVQPAMRVITAMAQTTTAVTGLVRLYSSLRSVTIALKGTAAATALATMHTRVQTIAMRALAIANGTATVSTNALRIATIALYATITGGIYLAVQGLISLFSSYNSTTKETAEKQDLLKDSADAYKSSVSQLKGEIDMEISSLAKLIKGHGDESGKVQELNQKYGDALGYHKSAAEWYDVLIRKSADYCKAIGYEAQAKVLASQKAEKEMQLEAVRKQKQALIDSGGDTTTKRVLTSGLDAAGNKTMKWEKRQVNTDEYMELRRQETRLVIENHNLGKSFEECMQKMTEGMSALQNTSRKTDVATMSYDELGKEIESTESKLKSLAPTETAEINRLSAYNKELKARKDALGKMTGLGGGNGSGKGTAKADIPVAPGSLEALEKKLNELKERQKKAPIEEQLTFTPDIVALEDLIENIRYRLKHADFEARYTLKPTEEGVISDAPIKRSMQSSTSLTQKEGGLRDLKLEAPKLDLEKPLEGMDAWNAAVDKAREKNAEAIGSMGAMGNAMGSLGEVIGGQAGAWMDWAGNLLNAIAQALPQLAALSTANTAAAATGAASSVASIPFVGPIIAVAAVASVLAALTSLPKFANGGIAYGPTLGLFGEYAGASNNPEVVAPLNRLRQLIQPAGPGGMSGDVRFRIDGRALTGILERETNLSRRS